MTPPAPNGPRPTEFFAAAPVLGAPVGAVGFLDLRVIYSSWWPVVDFAVFAAIFVGIAHATLGRRFEGRGGELLTIGVGAMLALGGLGAEWAYGFTLASLAPVAALVVFGLLAVTLVQLLVGLGCRFGTALALGLLCLAVAVSFVSPQFGSALGWVQAALQLLAIGGVLFLASHKVFGPDGVRGGEQLQKLTGRLKRTPSPEEDPTASWLRSQTGPLKAEKRSLAGALKPISRLEKKSAQRVLSELRLIRKVLARGPPSPDDRQVIAGALSRIPPARHELGDLLQRTREQTRRLWEFDNGVMRGATATATKGGSVREGSALYRVTLDERQKIEAERRLDYLSGFVQKYDANSGASIQRAAELLLAGDLAGAGKWLDEATRYEEEALKMIERTRTLERTLLRATCREVRQTKRA